MPTLRNWQTFWNWLTEPATAIRELEARRRVRIFSAVQLFMMIGLALPALHILPVDPNFESAPFLPELILQTAAYALSRTRYYKSGVIVSLTALLGMSIFASFTSPYFGPEVMALHLMWMVLPLLYGSVIFSRRNTILLSMMVLVSFLLLPPLIPELTYSDVAPVTSFVAIWSVGHLLVMRHNELLARRRRASLRETAVKLAAVNEMLQAEISERKSAETRIEASLQEKEILLKEIHHRVKNNLQIISSLLNLQSRQVQDGEALDVLRDSQHRVRSMALIHEKLYQSPNLARINFADYIRNLAGYLFQSYNVGGSGIELIIEAEEALLDIDTAVPCGLILNELVSNALKHGFRDGRSGQIIIQFQVDEQVEGGNGRRHYRLIVSDDGIGFPPYLDYRQTSTLGLQLVNTLVGQLEGSLMVHSNQGTSITVAFDDKLTKE